MKKSAILLFILFMSTGSLFSQVVKDSLGGNFIYPRFYDRMSPEESWEIHKEAYIKQLKAKGLTANEIKKEVADYEKQKSKFLKNVIKQRKLAAIRRENAEKLRGEAEIRRKQAAIQRQNAEKLRDEGEIRRTQAAILRKEAEVQRKRAEEWRDSFETIFTKRITFSSQSDNIKPIIIKIDKKTSLLFSVTGRISSGNTLIEIFNPNGSKEGELSLEYTKKSNSTSGELSKSTAAALNKTISDSEVGDWQIKILPKESEGTVDISVAKYIKPTVDE